MYIGWNVQEAENLGILASLKISHFPFWFPTLKGSIREREGNGKNPFPKFGNGKGMKKIHSQNSGTGREWKKFIPEIREREGNEKIHSQSSGKGIRGLHSWEWPGTGTGMGIIFYSLFWIFFFLALPWNFFHWLCAPKSFPDSPTCIVTPKKIVGQKPNVIFPGDTLYGGHF